MCLALGPARSVDDRFSFMRVGIVAPEFPPDIGGIETYGYEFCRELTARGHRVKVFTQPHATGEVGLPGMETIPDLRLRIAADREMLFKHAVDVWHVMNAAYAWLALESRPVLVSVHGNDFLRPYLAVARPSLAHVPGVWRSPMMQVKVENAIGTWRTARLTARALPHASHIFANSLYTERAFLRKYPSCRGMTSAAMVGVGNDLLEDPLPDTPLGASKLITVCRLAEPRKNVGRVLRALAKLKDRYSFSYTVVGDGPLRAGLERLSTRLGLGDRVRFTGFVEHATLRTLLRQSDLFVLTSSVSRASHEGFGIAYLEANACGIPVLAARLAGAVEAVDEGRSGFFADTPDTTTISKALERFLSQKVLFDRASCRAFAARFTWQRVVDHALGYYPGGGSS